MTKNETVLELLNRVVAQLPPETQQNVQSCARQIRGVVAVHGGLGRLALGIVGAEAAIEAESDAARAVENSQLSTD